LQDFPEAADGALEVMDAVAHDQHAHAGAADGQEFERQRFGQHHRAAARKQVAAEHAGQLEGEATEGDHGVVARYLRSTTMEMRRLAAAIGSAGTRRSRSALPVTLRNRASCNPESTSRRRVAFARMLESSQFDIPSPL